MKIFLSSAVLDIYFYRDERCRTERGLLNVQCLLLSGDITSNVTPAQSEVECVWLSRRDVTSVVARLARGWHTPSRSTAVENAFVFLSIFHRTWQCS